MVINFVNHYIALYLLTLLRVIIALLHNHVRPYKSGVLNIIISYLMGLYFSCLYC